MIPLESSAFAEHLDIRCRLGWPDAGSAPSFTFSSVQFDCDPHATEWRDAGPRPRRDMKSAVAGVERRTLD